MVSIISAASQKINKVLERFSVFLFAVITVLTFAGVISRYVFGSPIIWLYELTLVLFSWIVFLGISIAIMRNEHIYLDFIFHKINEKKGALLRVVINIILILFFTVVLKDSVEIIRETFRQNYNTIDISTGWFYLPLFICSAVSILHLVSRLLVQLRRDK